MSSPVLRCSGLVVRRGDAEILRDIDLELHPGEVLAILGPNGAGKSTLLEALGGIRPPAAGSISSSGRIATAMQSPDLARRTVRANVELALAWWGVPRAERRARAGAALESLHAEHLAGRRATALSGGERRRVHLARATAVESDVLLLDEPFAGLDPEARATLLHDTAAVLRKGASATVVVVHDRAEAWAIADRLIVILDGRIAAEGAPRDLLDRPPTAEVARFLGFDGEVRDGADRLLTRPAHVQLDPTADQQATVTAVIPLEDGARLELTLAGGHVSALSPLPAPSVGDTIRVRLTGGVRYPAGPE
jgi:ABC-type sugar transport system ATPase subunit